jgi:hypothetical protein
MNKRIAALGITATLLTGGVVGALIGAPGISNADTNTPTTTVAAPATTAGTSGTPATPGKFTPNTDPAHEAGESAAVEANEKLGIAPNGGPGGHDGKGGPRGHSNTDPAHEAAESPARVAEEAAHDAAIANGTAPTTAPAAAASTTASN